MGASRDTRSGVVASDSIRNQAGRSTSLSMLCRDSGVVFKTAHPCLESRLEPCPSAYLFCPKPVASSGITIQEGKRRCELCFLVFCLRLGGGQESRLRQWAARDPWTKALRTRLCSPRQILPVAGWPGLSACPQSVELDPFPDTRAQDWENVDDLILHLACREHAC